MNWVISAIRDKLSLLGRDMILETPEGVAAVRAILDPVYGTAEVSRTARGLADGYYPPGTYQYFGPPETDIQGARRLRDGKDCYEFRRTECCRWGDTPLYWWGLLIRCGGEDEES